MCIQKENKFWKYLKKKNTSVTVSVLNGIFYKLFNSICLSFLSGFPDWWYFIILFYCKSVRNQSFESIDHSVSPRFMALGGGGVFHFFSVIKTLI